MNAEKILGSDLLDIIFENRNKEYGAYALRKQYNDRLRKALFIMMAALAGVIALNYLSVNRSQNRGGLTSVFSIDSAVILTEIKLPQHPIHPVENKSRPPSPLPQFTVPMIIQSTAASDSSPAAEVIRGKINNDAVTGDQTSVMKMPLYQQLQHHQAIHCRRQRVLLSITRRYFRNSQVARRP